ncbi:CsbD family protein [Persicobacter diffluens]|uniref:CsbD family protein n=1 Tax=Persicobacter diffluens TaxID=981 RepID=A0AAN4W3P2_9BACT|nr:CsbD family protein [Persicobacter diffluens]
MNDLQVKGNWNETKGKLKQKYGDLVNDDALYAEGALDKLIGAIQKKTGESTEAIKKEINKLIS